jgi:hypothetical protein
MIPPSEKRVLSNSSHVRKSMPPRRKGGAVDRCDALSVGRRSGALDRAASDAHIIDVLNPCPGARFRSREVRRSMEIIVLGVVAGVSMLSYALWKKSRSDGLTRALVEERTQARLRSAEPGIHGLRPGDVVSHLKSDWLVEGVLSFDDDGRVTRLYRLADGATVRWLGARPGDGDPLLLEEVRDLGVPVDVNAPDQLLVDGAPYRLASRAQARVSLAGSGPRVPNERAWLYEYAGAGARRLFAVAWEGQTAAFAGEPIATSLLDILPGA